MTFKGMLKIVMNDYRKKHEQKMISIVDELVKTRRELQEIREKLHLLQSGHSSSSKAIFSMPVPTISLFVQYNGLFNELCDILQTITIKELLIKLRQLTGIPFDHPIYIRVLSVDGLKTLFFLDNNLDRTLAFYNDKLKPRMILSIEDDNEMSDIQNQHQRTYESDV